MRILLALIMAISVYAEVFIHITSWHSISRDNNDDWNPHNFGLGYRNEDNYKIGGYMNSYDEPAAYIGYDYFIGQHYGVQGGLLTGHKQPFGASLFYEQGHIRIDMMPIYTDQRRKGVALGFSMYF